MAKSLMTWLCNAGVLFLLVATIGCATSPERIARYISKHPDRPAGVCAALEDGTVVPGMTPEEVRLCMGPPNRVDHVKKPRPIQTWHYVRDSSIGGLKGSSLWAMEVPLAVVYFSDKGIVRKAILYSEIPEEPAGAERPGKPSDPKVSTPIAGTQSSPEPRRPMPPTPLPYKPAPEELGVSGWPSVSLSGVSVMGDDKSAVLNGVVIEPGEAIDGVMLHRVFVNGVLLVYRGQKTFIRPGETTR